MELRGVAETAQCPRCGERMPPDGQRLMTCTQCRLSFDPSKRTSKRPHRRRTPEDVPFGVEWKKDCLILRADNAWEVGIALLLFAGTLFVLSMADSRASFLIYVAIPLGLLALPFTAPITITVDATHVSRRVWPLWTRRRTRADIRGYRIIEMRYKGNHYWQIHATTADPARTWGLCAMRTAADADAFVLMLYEAEKAIPAAATA